jgi:hypothetical protein
MAAGRRRGTAGTVRRKDPAADDLRDPAADDPRDPAADGLRDPAAGGPRDSVADGHRATAGLAAALAARGARARASHLDRKTTIASSESLSSPWR